MAQTLRCVDELIRKIESQCKDEQKRDPSLEMPSVESTVLLVCDMQKRNNCANNPSIEHMLINSTFVIESCFDCHFLSFGFRIPDSVQTWLLLVHFEGIHLSY
eukprot:1132136_1